ncbi:MAG: aminopeptidase P family protein [Parasporobacterium sp.]|nr:aminopeptidase P family protein [Parasporobacterium sp.]
MNIYSDRINHLRKLMKAEGIDVYYIPMSDCHDSEYVGDHFRCIEFLTGFSGSAGHVLITMDEAWLFADGRYYIQAANQIEGSGIILMKWGQPDVPEPLVFVREKAKGKVLGFDGCVVNANFAEKISQDASDIKYEKDLVGKIWTDRPAQTFTEIWNLPLEYCGESSESKLARVRKEIEKEYPDAGSYAYLLGSLDDIAWVFNIRANDIPNNPVAYAYAVICGGTAHLLTNKKGYGRNWYQMEETQETNKKGYGRNWYPLEEKKETNEKGKAGATDVTCILMDKNRIGYSTYRYFKNRKKKIIHIDDPSRKMKAVKNETEIKCLKQALLRDSAVIIRLMRWVKENAGKIHLDEISIDEFLLQKRGEDPLFLEHSFDTIAAYKENAAMMHYEATLDTAKAIEAEGMLLVDSGGQYKDGTTDITRTFILGPVTDEEKKSFTLTAASMLRLLNAKFIEGCRGENLDIMTREPMWMEGMDYKCGTGHGVGHVLNVHEGPHNIRYRIGTAGPSAVLEEGMVVTDEPGVYREGAYGVRTENELLVVPYMETPDGKFLQFENLTFIPIDLDGIDITYLTEEDKKLLNNYHESVYQTMAPFFDTEMQNWLKEYTRPV